MKIATTEPSLGSIVLLEGPTGTAYQRLFSTGLFHSTTKGIDKGFTFAELEERAGRPGAVPILLVHEVDADGEPILPPAPSVDDVLLTLDALSTTPTARLVGSTLLAQASAALREYRRLCT